MSAAHQPAPPPAPAPSDQRTYVVDRIEAGVAVLVADEAPPDGASGYADMEAPIAKFAFEVAEGDVLRVPVRPDGAIVWETATADPEARARRLKQAEERLARLRKRDPGGDIAL